LNEQRRHYGEPTSTSQDENDEGPFTTYQWQSPVAHLVLICANGEANALDVNKGKPAKKKGKKH
jgi:hypothetical protein